MYLLRYLLDRLENTSYSLLVVVEGSLKFTRQNFLEIFLITQAIPPGYLMRWFKMKICAKALNELTDQIEEINN